MVQIKVYIGSEIKRKTKTEIERVGEKELRMYV